jgi:hypothetical protein
MVAITGEMARESRWGFMGGTRYFPPVIKVVDLARKWDGEGGGRES